VVKEKIYMVGSTPCINYRDVSSYATLHHATLHPLSSVPCTAEYEVELEDGSWKRVKRW
jgi:hypothetical protein